MNFQYSTITGHIWKSSFKHNPIELIGQAHNIYYMELQRITWKIRLNAVTISEFISENAK
jgi:hypothetical protein